jgi:hypothetical protein
MAAPTVADFQDRFATGNLEESRIEGCLYSSLRTVKVKLGVEAYNEIFEGETSTVEDSEYLDENETTADEEELRTGEVTDAAFYYTAACLVLNTQLRIRPSGIVKTEQDAGSAAMGRNMQITNEYISVSDARQYADWLRAEGDRMLLPYVIEAEPFNPWGASKVVRA